MVDAHKLGTLALQKAEAFRFEFGLSAAQGKSLDEWVALIGSGWAEGSVTDAPLWKTDLTDDGTPFEFSLSFKESGLEARVLVEPQQAPFDALSNWCAGLSVNERLRANGRHLGRFDAIESIFAPSAADADARFAIWHATATTHDGVSKVKVYVNPQIHGMANAPELTRKALETLGFSSAWTFLSTRLDGAELIYFSLDLEASSSARVKVYLAYPNAALEQIEEALQGGRGYTTGDAAEWVRSVTSHRGPYNARPFLVCWAFNGAEAAPRPTLHVPVRSYNASDAEAVAGFTRRVPQEKAELTRDALSRIHGRPLEAGLGFISYVSFQYDNNDVRLTAYLAPQLFAERLRESGVLPKRSTMRTMADVNDAIAMQAEQLREMPFLSEISTASVEEIQALASNLTFWVLAFQDVLRLGANLVSDPRLLPFAQTHAKEDHGHEQWFLSDVTRLGAGRELRWVFGAEHARVRDMSYAVISEVISAKSDHSRIAVLLCLEAAGSLFFDRIVNRLEALDRAHGLLYFARMHQDVEAAHEIFDDEVRTRWEAIAVSDDVHAEVSVAVGRTFSAMRQLAEHLNTKMREVRAKSAA